MEQIFANLLNLMLENCLSIAIVLKNGGLGACLQKNFVPPRMSENAHLQYSMYLFHHTYSC